MGIEEESRPAIPYKLASSSQDMPTTHYPDWSSSMQAYYGVGPMRPPFFVMTPASPTPNPYLGGTQHPFIPPNGMPVPYHGLLPPWGVYGQPNMTTTPIPIQVNAKLEGKGSDGNDGSYTTKSKDTLGSNKNNDQQIPNDNQLFLEVVQQIDGNETVCDLALEDNEDNDVQGHKIVAEPTTGMKFSSEEEVTLYYKQYAMQVGFGVVHQRSKKNLDGSLKYLTLGCACFGKKQTDPTNIGKPNPTTKMDCKARINAQLRDGAWFFTTVEVNHNHALSPKKARFFRSNRKVGADARRRLELNDNQPFLEVVQQIG